MVRVAADQVHFMPREKMMKEQDEVLQRQLHDLESQIDALEKAVRVEPDFGFGEGDPAITNRQVDRALLESVRQRAETLKRAISGHDQGVYGICEQCGNPIHPGRLAVLPDTKVCIRCARANQSE